VNIQEFEKHITNKGETWNTALIKRDLAIETYDKLTANTGQQLADIGVRRAKFEKQQQDYTERESVAKAAFREFATDEYMAKVSEATNQLAIVNNELAMLDKQTN